MGRIPLLSERQREELTMLSRVGNSEVGLLNGANQGQSVPKWALERRFEKILRWVTTLKCITNCSYCSVYITSDSSYVFYSLIILGKPI